MSARIERGGEGSKLWINKKTKNNVRYYYFCSCINWGGIKDQIHMEVTLKCQNNLSITC